MVENPYWQHFSGMRYFRHLMPMDPSSMTRVRNRLGEAGAEQMLRETIEAGMRMKAIRRAELQRLNVDTTVQTKALRFPTDAHLYHRMRERLVKTARAEGLQIKQSYQHEGKRLLMQSSRYAHAPADETFPRLHAPAKDSTWPSVTRDDSGILVWVLPHI